MVNQTIICVNLNIEKERKTILFLNAETDMSRYK